jgi:hypothetical protein
VCTFFSLRKKMCRYAFLYRLRNDVWLSPPLFWSKSGTRPAKSAKSAMKFCTASLALYTCNSQSKGWLPTKQLSCNYNLCAHITPVAPTG